MGVVAHRRNAYEGVGATGGGINSILVHNKENGKAAMINSAAYYWDGYYLGTAIQPPFGFEIETTEETPLGKHSLEIRRCMALFTGRAPNSGS